MKKEKYFLIFFLLFFILERLIKNILLIKKEYLFFKLIPNPYFLFFFKGDIFYFLVLMIFFLLIFLLIKSFKNKKYHLSYFLSSVFIGGLSNFLDRLLYGFVIDYFNFFSVFSFNFSDIMILLGTILFIIKSFKPDKINNLDP
ncbi:MAG: signal peptidase II [Patescibacteria group bacterium]|nr:signal peptidase II [Patescibacteria group bacterium]